MGCVWDVYGMLGSESKTMMFSYEMTIIRSMTVIGPRFGGFAAWPFGPERPGRRGLVGRRGRWSSSCELWFIGIYNNHYKDPYYGWGDHQPYSEYWPWLMCSLFLSFLSVLFLSFFFPFSSFLLFSYVSFFPFFFLLFFPFLFPSFLPFCLSICLSAFVFLLLGLSSLCFLYSFLGKPWHSLEWWSKLHDTSVVKEC